jgi:hypothetical protein
VVVVSLGVCPELLVAAAGGVLLFFFALAAVVVCAPARDPATRNALIQKLAANFRYFFIVVLSNRPLQGLKLRLHNRNLLASNSRFGLPDLVIR